MNRWRTAATFGLGFSAAVLVVSYIVMATYTSQPWLWSVIVHESGDRTLLQTVFYYEHTARELPLDIILGVAVAGSVLFALPPPAGTARARRRVTMLGSSLAAVTAVILAGTLWTGGPGLLYENLLQFPTRPGEPLVWGGHWRYHLLSQLTLMLASLGVAVPMMLAVGQRRGHRRGLTIFLIAIAVFLALALVFRPGAESFTDPRFLGHQTREVFTQGLVTVPMAWSMCVLLAGRDPDRGRPGTVPVALSFIAAGAAIGLGGFLLVASLATSAVSEGQSDSLAVMIFPHFFEHTFSYLVTTLTAALLVAANSAGAQVNDRR